MQCICAASVEPFSGKTSAEISQRHVNLGVVRHCKHVAGTQQRHTVLNVDGSILFKIADGVGADVVGWH